MFEYELEEYTDYNILYYNLMSNNTINEETTISTDSFKR